MVKATILRPSILVSLKTTVKGSAHYEREELGEEREGDEKTAKWKTTVTITDVREHEAAGKVRSKARSMIASICSKTAFGLLCPCSREQELQEAINGAVKLAEDFNRMSAFAKVEVYAINGRVTGDDEQAVRAISSELRDLLGDMNKAIQDLDPEAIRDAANRARQVGMILDTTQQARVNAAVEAARAAARDITRRVEKNGEDRLKVLADVQGSRSVIDSMRMSFLDLDEPGESAAPLPSANLQRFDGLDINSIEASTSEAPTPALEAPAPLPAPDAAPEAPAAQLEAPAPLPALMPALAPIKVPSPSVPLPALPAISPAALALLPAEARAALPPVIQPDFGFDFEEV